MRQHWLILALLGCSSIAAACPDLLNHEFRRLASDERDRLCEVYADTVVLVVNTASRCAFTPQYEGLESLYSRYRDRGFAVIGFPSNDFGGQEPGTEATIRDFCRLTYSVQFPMYEKTSVSGRTGANPFYLELARQSGDGLPRWNFHKYLLDRSGRVVASYPSSTPPEDPQLVEQIESLLD